MSVEVGRQRVNKYYKIREGVDVYVVDEGFVIRRDGW
jgi:hypothetical protein